MALDNVWVFAEAAEARQAGRVVEDEGEGFAEIVAFLDNLKVI